VSDDLFSQLADLPALDIDELGGARVRQSAHQVLERKREGRPAKSRASRALFLMQSTVVGAVATGYLVWVVEIVLSPYR
jgi:hypothetical protein